MFILHIIGKFPEIHDLPDNVKVVFLAKTTSGMFFLITAPKNANLKLSETNKLVDFTSIGLTAFLGVKTDFTQFSITNGCMISNQGFAHGKEIAFSFHGKEGPDRLYSLSNHSFEKIFIRF